MMHTYENMRVQAIEAIIEELEVYNDYYCDLHNRVFNEDWYIIGTARAKDALREYDVFDALELVQSYEKDNFGEINTNLGSPEELISMVWYIIGDEIICEMCEDIELFNENWNNEADEENNVKIIEAMKEIYNI